MLAKNMGQTDRAIRAVIGVLAFILAFTVLTGVWTWIAGIAGIVGVVMLATAAMGSCPPYQLLGINTCSTRAR